MQVLFKKTFESIIKSPIIILVLIALVIIFQIDKRYLITKLDIETKKNFSVIADSVKFGYLITKEYADSANMMRLSIYKELDSLLQMAIASENVIISNQKDIKLILNEIKKYHLLEKSPN